MQKLPQKSMVLKKKSLVKTTGLLLLFIALCGNIKAETTIETFAGSGNQGYAGDEAGSLANDPSVKLDTPTGVAIDAVGNVYIADQQNHVIRKVSAEDGTISLFAGQPQNPGNLGDGDIALLAQLNSPTGLCYDAAQNRLIIADKDNYCIRAITLDNNKISTIAGSIGMMGNNGDNIDPLNALFQSPVAVALNKEGNFLYIADANNHVVRYVDFEQNLIFLFAGDNGNGFSGDRDRAISAQLDYPSGLAVNSDGSQVFIADQNNHVVRYVTTSDGIIDTYSGLGLNLGTKTGTPGETRYNLPSGLAIGNEGDGSVLYVSEIGNHVVKSISLADGNSKIYAGNGSSGYLGDGGAPTDAKLDSPWGMALDTDGQLHIAEYGNHVIRRVTLPPPCVDPDVPTLNGPTLSFCTGSSTTLNIVSGNLNNATAWKWYTGSCGGTLIATTITTTLSVSPTVSTVYYVRGEGGCITPGTCASMTVTPDPAPIVNPGQAITTCLGLPVTLQGSGADGYSWSNGVTNGVPFVPTLGTTTYTVVGTYTNSCPNSEATVSVTVNPLPTASISGDFEFCSGLSSTITASGGITYLWDNGETGSTTDVDSGNEGNFSVVITDANGCLHSDTAVIVVYSLPTLTATSNTTICRGSSTTLTVIGADSYSWTPSTSLSNNTGSTVSANPTVTTTYTITGIGDHDCEATKTIRVAVEICGGIEENMKANFATIYPNPSNGTFTIALNNTASKKVNITIFDAIGKVVLNKNLNDVINQIDLTNIEKGIYLVYMSSEGLISTNKLVIE